MKKRTVLAAILGLALPAAAQTEPPARLREAAARSLVPVRFHLRRVEGESVGDWRDPAWPYQRYLRDRIPLETAGLVLDAEGRVLVADNQLDFRWVERIELDAGAGPVPARRERVLRGAPALVLRAESAAGLAPARFEDAPAVDETTVLHGASLYLHEGRWVVWSRRMVPLVSAREPAPALRFTFGSLGFEFASVSYQGSLDPPPIFLVGTAQSGPFALSFFNRIDVDGSRGLWKAKEVVASGGIAEADLEALRAELTDSWKPAFPRVTLRYRPEKSEPGAHPWSSMVRGFRPDQEDPAAPETTFVGAALAADRILVPARIDRAKAARIDAIRVQVGEKTLEGTLVGALLEWEGFLVRTAGPLPLHLSGRVAAGPLPRVEPVLAFLAEEKHDATRITVEPTRFLEAQRGFGGRWHPTSQRVLRPGTWLLAEDGAVHGAWLAERRAEEEQEDAARSDRSRFYSRGPDETRSRFAAWSEVAALLTEAEALDPSIVARAKGEEKRRVWLGVETSPMTRELAKSLSCSAETRGGTLGLIVNVVYPGSPAEEAGLREGDVLLKVSPKGRRDPIELEVPSGDEAMMSHDYAAPGMEEAMERMGMQHPERCPWPSQDNRLNRLLLTLGAGRETEVTLFRSGKLEQAKARIAAAPPDYESAPRATAKEAGLTVREVTYEVRRALKLEKDLAAVVVSKVEPGTPAAQAKLRTYELITEVDGKPVASPEALKKALEDAATGGKPSLKLTVLRLGKSRFADLKLEK